jgi:hypothetical protein
MQDRMAGMLAQARLAVEMARAEGFDATAAAMERILSDMLHPVPPEWRAAAETAAPRQAANVVPLTAVRRSRRPVRAEAPQP